MTTKSTSGARSVCAIQARVCMFPWQLTHNAAYLFDGFHDNRHYLWWQKCLCHTGQGVHGILAKLIILGLALQHTQLANESKIIYWEGNKQYAGNDRMRVCDVNINLCLSFHLYCCQTGELNWNWSPRYKLDAHKSSFKLTIGINWNISGGEECSIRLKDPCSHFITATESMGCQRTDFSTYTLKFLKQCSFIMWPIY